jgi:hypothetical protein
MNCSMPTAKRRMGSPSETALLGVSLSRPRSLAALVPARSACEHFWAGRHLAHQD